MASPSSITWSPNNNSSTVRALLVHRLKSGEEPQGPVHPYYQPWSSSPSASNSQKPSEKHSTTSSKSSPPAGCPMHVGGGAMGGGSGDKGTKGGSLLNPLNKMPTLTQDRAPNQKVELSTERVMSTIPRLHDSAPAGGHPYQKSDQPISACPIPHEQRSAMTSTTAAAAGSSKDGTQAAATTETEGSSEAGHWEYPSPQQFYNALVRKGWETPEEHVEMMVMVHNFLNERAWLEVLDWEKEMGVDDSQNRIALARFQGKPGTLSPKARLFSWLAVIAPSKFNSEPPFDRHDWVVRRPPTSLQDPGQEIRYVIDYYSAPDDPDTDEPVFYLDVRPALDSWQAAQARIKRTWSEWRNQEATSG